MADTTLEQQRFKEYQQIDGPSLHNLKAAMPSNLVPDNQGPIPQFFHDNLVSPYRVLKLFQNSPHSNLRVFYFTLLRITYEIETELGYNRSFIYNLIQIVFHQQFQILFTEETDNERDLFNDTIFKKLFAEFIEMLDNEDLTQVEVSLNNYPIMDTVLIHILRSILASQNIAYSFEAKIPTSIAFSELSSLLSFNINELEGGGCWKFQDADMFCYEHSQNQLYLAYIVDSGVVESDQASQNAAIGRIDNHIESETVHTISLASERRAYDPLGQAPLTQTINYSSVSSAYNNSGSYQSPSHNVLGSLGGSSYQPTYKYESSYETPKISYGLDVDYKPISQNYDSKSVYDITTSRLNGLGSSAVGTANYSYASAYESSTNNAYTLNTGNFPSLPAAQPSTSVKYSGDYYNDFTNDRLLEKIVEPFRSRVVQIKDRARQYKRVDLSFLNLGPSRPAF